MGSCALRPRVQRRPVKLSLYLFLSSGYHERGSSNWKPSVSVRARESAFKFFKFLDWTAAALLVPAASDRYHCIATRRSLAVWERDPMAEGPNGSRW